MLQVRPFETDLFNKTYLLVTEVLEDTYLNRPGLFVRPGWFADLTTTESLISRHLAEQVYMLNDLLF